MLERLSFYWEVIKGLFKPGFQVDGPEYIDLGDDVTTVAELE